MNFPVARLLETPLAGNLATMWLLAGLLAVVLIVALVTLRGVLGRRLRPTGPAGALSWRDLVRDLIERTTFLFILVLGLFAGSRMLELPPGVQNAIGSVFIVVLFVQAALWGDRMASAVMNWRLGRSTDGSIRSALALIQFMGRLVVWSIAFLLILDNLGFDVTALVAGLGIGGVAVALAAQSVLGDLFASLAIVLDKPFEVGDFIIFGDGYLGTVERIGIKTTRIRALSGEQLVVANGDLLNSRIRNYKRMQQRRIVFSIGVTYETPADKLARIPAMLKQIIEAQGDKSRFDRAHLRSFGDFAINYEVVHWVQSADYNVYMDVQQDINLAIIECFANEGIEFAYPTQMLHLYQSPEMAARIAGRGQEALRHGGGGQDIR